MRRFSRQREWCQLLQALASHHSPRPGEPKSITAPCRRFRFLCFLESLLGKTPGFFRMLVLQPSPDRPLSLPFLPSFLSLFFSFANTKKTTPCVYRRWRLRFDHSVGRGPLQGTPRQRHGCGGLRVLRDLYRRRRSVVARGNRSSRTCSKGVVSVSFNFNVNVNMGEGQGGRGRGI